MSPPKKTVLIVEDTDTIASLIQVYLMGWNLKFLVAKNGREGFEQAKSSAPDLILTDVQMPEMDGFALCAAVRADPNLHEVPVVLLTSLKDEASRMKGRLVGATAFLAKPVALNELRDQVSNLLRLEHSKGAPR